MPDALDSDYSRSRAVLIGTWKYRHLKRVPAAEHSLERMRALLASPLCGGWPDGDRMRVVANRDRPGDLPHELVEWLGDAADVALFYYVGHGQYDNDDRLCLALRDTSDDPVLRTTTSLTFDAVRHAFRASRAATKIAILDCCFAGLAAGPHGALAPAARDLPRSSGFYLMMASGEHNTAWCQTPIDGPEPQTYFTRYLADVIERDIPGQPEGLTLGPVFDQVADALALDGKPEPRSRASDHASRFVFARNRATPTAGGLVSQRPDATPGVPPAAATPASTSMTATEMFHAAQTLEADRKEGLKHFDRMEALHRAASARRCSGTRGPRGSATPWRRSSWADSTRYASGRQPRR